MCSSKKIFVVQMENICYLQAYCVMTQGCKKADSSKNDRFWHERIGETQPETEVLEAVYMEFHYARHEKISLRCPLEALIAFTCANRKEISWRVVYHVGDFDRYEISCRGYT